MGVYLYPNNTETELKNAYIGIPNPISIVLDESSISLTTIWQTAQLTATIEPTISDHSITWSSDDTTVATVDTTWLVTCVTPWTCTITATTVNNLTATCGVRQARLPAEYQEVEWIESSWTQYINTWVKGSNTISTELVMRPNMSYTSEYAVFGDAWSASALFFMEYQWKYRLHNWGNYWDFANVTNEKTTITTNSSGITINGVSYTLTAGSSYSNKNVWLFGLWDGGNSSKRGRFKVYSFQMSDNNVLIRDFVPCYRIADTVIWLYDIVNNVFYTNAGSGTFTKWWDV
jgi:hypothetical protein